MGRVTRATALAIGTALALVGAGCGDDKPESDDPLVRLLQRVDKADDDLGARATVRGTLRSGSTTFHIRGYGQVEADEKRDRFVFVTEGVREETFDDGSFTFIAADAGLTGDRGELPPGTEWLKIDQDVVAEAAGTKGLRELQSLSPTETVKLLPKLDPTITTAGSERVHGVLTRRYRITVPIAKLIELVNEKASDVLGCPPSSLTGSMSIVLWIDRQDLVRRARLRFRIAGQSIVLTTTITRFDRELRVDVPTGPTVFDATKVVAKQARKERGQRRNPDCSGRGAERI